MDTIAVRRAVAEAEVGEWKNKRVTARNATPLPSGPVEFVDADTGQPFCLLTQAGATETNEVRQAMLAYRDKFTGVVRAGGMRSKSSTFGFSAPNAVMQRFAPSASSWAWQHPQSHAVMCEFAATAQTMFDEFGPAPTRAVHDEARNNLHPDWRLADTAWTSGIVNDTAPLYYHYDRNNTPDTWSAMITVRAGTRGGHLHIADYDITLPCRDGDVCFFPGMDLMHGVTPIQPSLKGGYRFTAVYYSVKRFLGLPGSHESVTKAQNRRAELEGDLLQRQRDTGMLK